MQGRKGIPLVLLAGALITLGVAWGASIQKETFLGNQVSDAGEASSDLTVLTGFFVGAGVALLLASLSQAPARRRVARALLGGVAAWFLIPLLQGAYPNYVVVPEYGVASILQSNLLIDATGSPSVLLPVFALGILLMVSIGWAVRGLHQHVSPTPSLSTIRQDQLAITALAIPALVITAGGMIRVMLEYPADMEGIGLVLILNPLAAAACMLLAVSIALRSRQVARLQHDPDLAWPVMESWRAMDRIDLAGIVTIGLVAATSTFLPSQPLDITSAGPTLGFTPRSHGQAIVFLAVVLMPLYFLHRRIGDLLPTARQDVEPSGSHVKRDAWAATAVVGAASLAGFVLSLTSTRTLLPWIVALVPSAIASGIVGRPRASALVRLVAAWAMWGAGNTIFGSYDASTFPDLQFVVHPGVLALWRLAAAVMLAWVVHDVLREEAEGQPLWVAMPLSLAAAVGVALALLLQLPLNVWAEATLPTNKVAAGSLLMSQQLGVQVVMHIITVAGLLGASMATARILRPDWFRRRFASTVDDTVSATPG